MSTIGEDRAGEGALAWVKRLGVRWATVYLALYILFEGTVFGSLQEYNVPGMASLSSGVVAAWATFVPWVGEHLLSRPIAVRPIADYLFHYVQLGIILVIAFIAAAVWASLDRDSEREHTFYEGTRILVRYTLAIIMLGFGVFKTSHIQFAYPGPIHLMEPMGSMTPTGLMWAFMGYSTLYSFFAGFAEIAGGILVLFRRTTTLGALIIAGVMTNVVLMNVSYDVFVRSEAAHYLVMAIFLLAADAQRLMNAIVPYTSMQIVPVKPGRPKTWRAAVSVAAKVLVIGWALFYLVPFSAQFVSARNEGKKMPMSGLYRVGNFQNGANGLNTHDTGSAWERVGIEGYNDVYGNRGYLMAVRTSSDAMKYYALRIDGIDPTHGLFKLIQCNGYACPYWNPLPPNPVHIVLSYNTGHRSNHSEPKRDTNDLTLRGNISGVPVSMRLTRMDTSTFLLERIPFHVIESDDSSWNV